MSSVFPRISIVTPVFNQVGMIEETIKSVLDQRYPNLEYIIIDGGSTDGTVDIIKKYEDSLSYWVSEPDNGMYDAIRKGFEHSSGEVLSWINSDDMYHQGALSIVSEIFSTFPQVEWIEGAHSLRDYLGRTYCVRPFAGPRCRADLLLMEGGWIQQESVFWRRSLYEKVGGISSDWRLAGDYGLWLKFSQYTDLYLVDALIGGFRIWSDKQLSGNMEKYRGEMMAIQEQEALVAPGYLNRYRRLIHVVAFLNKRVGVFKWDALLDRFKRKHMKSHIGIVYNHSTRRYEIVDI